MSIVDYPPVYDEFVNLLVRTAKPEDVLSFQLSDDRQQQLDELLSKNREGDALAAGVGRIGYV